VQCKKYNTDLPYFGVIALCSFLLKDITDTLRDMIKKLLVDRSNSALPYLIFGVIALCLFSHFELCPVHNSEFIRDIYIKLCR
jgi:hypothetical protein